jgi:hypothetical protein
MSVHSLTHFSSAWTVPLAKKLANTARWGKFAAIRRASRSDQSFISVRFSIFAPEWDAPMREKSVR